MFIHKTALSSQLFAHSLHYVNTFVHPQNSFVIHCIIVCQVCSFSALCQHICPSSKQLCHPLYAKFALSLHYSMSTRLSNPQGVKTSLPSMPSLLTLCITVCQHVCPMSILKTELTFKMFNPNQLCIKSNFKRYAW